MPDGVLRLGDTIALVREDDVFVRWSDSTATSLPIQVVAGDGRVFVMRSHTMDVHVLSEEGRPIASFGRRGAGPGEFLGMVQGIVVDSSIWIMDAMNGRVSNWTVSGELVREFRLEEVGPWVSSFAVLSAESFGIPAQPASGAMVTVIPEEPHGVSVPMILREYVPEGLPFLPDRFTTTASRIVLFENGTGRVISFAAREPSAAVEEVRLPQSITTQLDSIVQAFSAGNPGGTTPTQLISDLQPIEEGDRVLVKFIRPLPGNLVGGIIDFERKSMDLLALAHDREIDSSYVRSITALAALRDCFLLGTSLGVERYCPTRVTGSLR